MMNKILLSKSDAITLPMGISDTVVTSWAFYMGASSGPCLYLLKFTDSIWILASIINRKSVGVRYLAVQGLHGATENFADMNALS